MTRPSSNGDRRTILDVCNFSSLHRKSNFRTKLMCCRFRDSFLEVFREMCRHCWTRVESQSQHTPGSTAEIFSRPNRTLKLSLFYIQIKEESVATQHDPDVFLLCFISSPSPFAIGCFTRCERHEYKSKISSLLKMFWVGLIGNLCDKLEKPFHVNNLWLYFPNHASGLGTVS